MVVIKAFGFSLFFIILGAIVWKRQIIDFIAGFNRLTINNPRKLAKTIGIIIMAYGVEIFLLIVVNEYVFSLPSDIVLILAIIHCLAIIYSFLHDRFLMNS